MTQATAPESQSSNFTALARTVLKKVDEEPGAVADLIACTMTPGMEAAIADLGPRGRAAAVIAAFNVTFAMDEYSVEVRGRMVEWCILGIHIGRML